MDFITFRNVIDGKLVASETTRHGINPANLVANPEVPVSTKADVEAAISASRLASKVWAEVPTSQRQMAVIDFATAVLGYKEQFADLLVLEQGKPRPFALQEIETACFWLIEIAKITIEDEVIQTQEDKDVTIQWTPLGVVVGIVPWNFPVMLACGKIGPALTTGNALILKPSPYTPYCGLKLAELAQKFFPPGVFQALSGGDDLGPMLTSHPDVDKLSFTGSTATGKRIMESASTKLKSITLELGGNDPAIVCKDVDIPQAAAKIASLAFFNSGQICIAIKRIYVHASIYQTFRDAMVEFTKTLKVGSGSTPGVYLGPVQNEMQYNRVKGFLDDIKEQNLTVALGGEVKPSGGYFIDPTIVENPPDDARIVVEEPFGPIIPIMSWEDEDEVLKRANKSELALGASVWTSDPTRAQRLARKIHAGSVWVNTHSEINPRVPFGGLKQSGIGSEWGLPGLKSFCNSQALFHEKK